MSIVQQGEVYIDTETGEVLTAEAYALHTAALEAAQSFARYDRARLDLEALKHEIEVAIAAQFPQLMPLQETVAGLKKAHETRVEALRTAALAQHTATGEKTFLGGIVGVATVSRKTFFDVKEAHDWVLEMKRWDLFKVDEKGLTDLAKAGQLPEAVMRFEDVAETRVSEAKLSALVSEVQS